VAAAAVGVVAASAAAAIAAIGLVVAVFLAAATPQPAEVLSSCELAALGPAGPSQAALRGAAQRNGFVTFQNIQTLIWMCLVWNCCRRQRYLCACEAASAVPIPGH
jgi:hypothetical protein